MCGITGIWNWDDASVSVKQLAPFTNALSHRGPDGSGFYVDDSAQLGLGHRRLSILDLSDAGKQPMSYANQRYWLTYNGEIYNFVELRHTLKKEGYSFRSDCDSEVILAAYDHWGPGCLSKMNGMWSFCIWDTHRKKLFLARDRYGIKPLHYAVYRDGRAFAFASETLAFKSLPGFCRQFDTSKVSLAIKNPRALEAYGHTIYEDIYQLLPGHYMMISSGEKVQQKRWWDLPEPSPTNFSPYQKQQKTLSQLFRDACNLRMRSDVPIATALSGGVDSSSVYCMLHNLHDRQDHQPRSPGDWQQAFIASFPGTDKDEVQYADAVVDKTGGKSTRVYPGSDASLTDWVKSTIRFDSIYTDPNFVIGALYQRMSERGFKVSLDGHGVDEMMYGYPELVRKAYAVANDNDTQYGKVISDIFQNMSNTSLASTSSSWVSMLKDTRLARRTKDALPETLKKPFRYALGLHSPKPQFGEWLTHPSDETLSSLTDSPTDLSSYDGFQQILINSFYIETLPCILRNFDRASMRHGVEIRMPFMDWRLVNFVFSLPPKSILNAGYTKRILRDIMKGLLPESVRTRTKKVGISAPLNRWLGHEMIDDIRDITHSSAFLNTELWKGKEIQNAVEKIHSNDGWTMQRGYKLWPYINAYILMSDEISVS